MPQSALVVLPVEQDGGEKRYTVIASRGLEFDADTARMILQGDLVAGFSSAEQCSADSLVTTIQRLGNFPIHRAETYANRAVQVLRRQREWMDGRVFVARP